MHVSVFMDHACTHVIIQDQYRGLYVNASYAHTVVTILVVLYKRSIALHVKSLPCRVLGTSELHL